MAAVQGFDPAKSGQNPTDSNGNPVPFGVWGDTTTGVGVFGTSGLLAPGDQDIPTDVAGVQGHSRANPGVLGRSVSDAGVTGESLQSFGVLGRSQAGSGMLGVSFGPPQDGKGLFGVSTTGGDGVVGFVGGATAVVGNSVRGDGVYGISGTGNGVVGENYTQPGDPIDPVPAGVVGRSAIGNGVTGESTSGSGVFGLNDGANVGVWGSNCSNDAGIGVRGSSLAGTGAVGTSLIGDGLVADTVSGTGVDAFSSRGTGVVAETGSPDAFAGVFLGRVRITGALSKGGGGFEIDHPLDPGNRYLSHSFVESPDMLNVYCGTVTTDDDGAATVELPDYFEALNRDFCYQLTVIGQFAQAVVTSQIERNRFTVGTDKPQVTVCWQVTGIRRDRWADLHRIPVEARKSAQEQGRYLHPEVWEQPGESRIHGRSPAATKRTRAFEEQLDRARALLPQEVCERLDARLQDLSRGADVPHDELRGLLAEGLAQARIPRRPSRTTRARLEQDWQEATELARRGMTGDAES